MDSVTKEILTKCHASMELIFQRDNLADAQGKDRLLTDQQQVDLAVAIESVSDILKTSGVTIGA